MQREQSLNGCERGFAVCVGDKQGSAADPRARLTAGGEAVKLLHGRSTVSGVKHESLPG